MLNSKNYSHKNQNSLKISLVDIHNSPKSTTKL